MKPVPTDTPQLVTPESPWLGLRPYTEAARDYFFGRDRELADLFDRVAQKPLTVLFGQSGLGKTSLLQAALVPRLRRAGFLPVLLRLDHGAEAPVLEAQVLQAIREVVDPSVVSFPTPGAVAPLWRLLHDPAFGLCPSGSPRVVLLVDQFEEIFTLGEASPGRRAASHAFLASLADVVENRLPAALRAALEEDEAFADRVDYTARPLKVLLSLREDYLHRLERWRQQFPSLMDNRAELRLLTGSQALHAVIEPGRIRCAQHPDLPPIVNDETGSAIVRFVAGAAPGVPLAEIDAVPPLLSLLCAELNAQRGGSLEIRSEQLAGRAEDILAQFYERCFAPHPPAVRTFVEERLLSPEGYRQNANEDTFFHQMQAGAVSIEDARRILKRLVDDRLLVSEERGGIHRIELTHDTLTGVARASRGLRHAREAGEKRRRQRQRAAIIVTGLALLAATISIPLMLWALAEKKKGEALLLEASFSDSEESLRKLEAGEWNTAVAYAARALRIRPDNSEVARRLFTHTLLAGTAPSRVLPHPGPVTAARFLPGENALLTVAGGQVFRWERASTGFEWNGVPIYSAPPGGRILGLSPAGNQICLAESATGALRLWNLHASVSGPAIATWDAASAMYSPDGARLVVVGRSSASAADDGKNGTDAKDGPGSNGAPTVWDAASGASLGTLEAAGDKEDPVAAAAFSPDASRILTGSKLGTVRCWRMAAGGGRWEQEWSLEDALPGGVADLEVSPDGTRFATVSSEGVAGCWAVPTRFRVASWQSNERISCAVFSPDGSLAATGGAGGEVLLWDRATGKTPVPVRGHSGSVNTIAFSPDGATLLTSSDDGTARLWEVAAAPLNAPEANIGPGAEPGRIASAPAWLYEDLLPFLCGRELDRQGKISDVPVTRLLEAQRVLDDRLVALKGEGAGDAPPWNRFLAWKFLSDSRTRSITPYASVTVPAFAEAQSMRAGPENTAWQVAPGNPMAEWNLGSRYRARAWGAWLVERALRTARSPEAAVLYGKQTTERWSEFLASQEARIAASAKPFTNSLGMKFVPLVVTNHKNLVVRERLSPGEWRSVPVSAVAEAETILVSVWLTRVKDYAAYAADKTGVDGTWKDLTFKGQKVYTSEDCPVAAVSWDDARAFCDWLTAKERAAGTITNQQRYQLPTDEQWSWAVGIGEEEEEALQGGTPKEKDSRVVAYPWGTLRYPPLDEAGHPLGNYADSRFKEVFPEYNAIAGYTDGYALTSPVGTFPAEAHGLFDIGGNLWEWCEEWYDPGEKKGRVLRGASWRYGDYATTNLLSSCRDFEEPSKRLNYVGFRCVLVSDSSAPR